MKLKLESHLFRTILLNGFIYDIMTYENNRTQISIYHLVYNSLLVFSSSALKCLINHSVFKRSILARLSSFSWYHKSIFRPYLNLPRHRLSGKQPVLILWDDQRHGIKILWKTWYIFWRMIEDDIIKLNIYEINLRLRYIRMSKMYFLF